MGDLKHCKDLIEKVAQAIWWNAGINEPEILKRTYRFQDGTPVPPPTWGAVRNKEMWRKQAVAALVVAGISLHPDAPYVKEIRRDVPMGEEEE